MRKHLLFVFVVCAVVGSFVLKVQSQSLAANADQPSKFVYDDAGKRDPFFPLLDSDGNVILYDNELILSDLKLEGVMLSSTPEKSGAIVNGRIVKTRERIGMFQVEKILKDKIILKKGQETYELILKKE